MSKFIDESDMFLIEHHPAISAAKPVWATTREDYIIGTDVDGSIVVHYSSPDVLEAQGGDVTAVLFEEAVYDPDAHQVRAKSLVLSVAIGSSELINFTTPEEARATARALTLAAEKFEELR